MDARRSGCLLAFGFFVLGLTSCAPSLPTLTTQATSLGTACDHAVERFATTPTKALRQDVLDRLKALNAALIETAEHEQQARRFNSVDLPDANRALLETGTAWGTCSLRYNGVLVAIGERDAARYNYRGLLERLTGPQFTPITRKIRAALAALNGSR